MPELPPKIYEALGRMTWAAMGVEERARSLTLHVLGFDRTAKPVGTLIQAAIERLERVDANPPRPASVEWLKRARAGLERRNEVLHSEYIEWWDETDGKVERSSDSYLLHLPNKQSKPAVHVSVDEETFDGIAQELNETIAAWGQAYASFFDDRGPG
ncbi:MAG: hypothetical protein RJQ01_00830 [Microcella sp.]|uniref:hypothetical protein n=1 Tax=Microcella sp. TaxID=1913979 RepID=UPI00331580BC